MTLCGRLKLDRVNNFRNTHLWLLVPFAIVVLGFAPSYWFKFTEAPWRHHLHGLTATLWFVILLTQPYLITRGNTRLHRLYGMFALFVAGGVVVSALATLPYIIANERMHDAAKYGLTFVDIVVVSGFSIAVLMAIKTARSVDDHARWMISTAFWAVMPGLFRLVNTAQRLGLDGERLLKLPQLLAALGALNILVLGYLMFRDRRAHPAYLLAAAGSVSWMVALPVSRMAWWRDVADAVFTM